MPDPAGEADATAESPVAPPPILVPTSRVVPPPPQAIPPAPSGVPVAQVAPPIAQVVPPAFGPSAAARPHVPSRPPIWPSLVAPPAGIVASIFVAGIAWLLAYALTVPDGMSGDVAEKIGAWTESSTVALVVMILASQSTLLLVALGSTLFGRGVPVARQLGFVRWKTSHGTVALSVLGTLGVAYASTYLLDVLFEEPSESLKRLWQLISRQRGAAAVAVTLLLSILPGLCEEALFRGSQTGLLRRWPPFAAIGVTSVLFAVAHLDFQHALGVLPLGIWFGFIAWKTGSIWTTVLAHFLNNLVAFIVARAFGDETGDIPQGPIYFATGFVLIGLTVLATVVLLRARPRG